MARHEETRTGGRPATTGVIAGRYALSVGNPETPLPQGWRWTPIAEVARLETGHTPSRRHSEYWDGGVPWIGIKDATDNHGRTIHDTYQHASPLGIENSSARLLPPNTVCLSRTASVGYVVVMGRSMATSQDFVNWVCSDALDYRYLKYVLLAERDTFRMFASGTTHQTIYFPEVKAFHIALPPPREQREIADVLGGLDDKIELNRRMSETLESMARALFKSWFVDFDPVRAKEKGRPTALSNGVSGLFPCSFEKSELGPIPGGWNVGSLLSEADLLSGGTPKTDRPDYWGGGIPWASAKDVSQASDSFLLETERTITEAGLSTSATQIIPSSATVVVARGATTGRMVLLGREMAMNQTCYALVSKTGHPFTLNCALRHRIGDLVHAAHGSVFDTITTSTFRNTPFLLPPRPLLDSFEGAVAPLFLRALSSVEESRTLSALRDALLPRLISGAVRVRDR